MADQANLAGELVVVALKARDLPNREVVGKQDPFCIFRLGEVAKRTKTDLRGGQHPLWDDQITVPVPRGKTKLYMQVFDEDGSREDLISEGELDLTTVLKDGEQDGWFPLKYRGKPAGQIYLELTFYSARPPPKLQPTRYGNKRSSYQQHGYYHTPPPQATGQAPMKPSAWPPGYQPPPLNQQQDQVSRPHMPPAITPSTSAATSISAGSCYSPSNRLSSQNAYQPQSGYATQHGYYSQQHEYPPQSGYLPQQGYPPQQQGYPPQHSYQPQQSPRPQGYQSVGSTQPPPTLQQGDTPLLASTFRTYHPSPPESHHGDQMPMSFNNTPTVTQGYPPQNGTPGSTFAFPEPQAFHGGYTPYNNPNGRPFAVHQSSYHPPAVGGYPPAPAGPGYPQYGDYRPSHHPQQQQHQQPSYPPH